MDLNEQSRVCEQSLLVRSKPSPLRTWLQRWKRDSWTRHLSGRILRPSLGNAFARKWTCYLADIHVSRSQARDSAKEKTIRGISGPGLQMELGLFDQPSVSSRTSKDISAWGCPTSSKTWQEWVIERRGAYSARLKSAHRTSASGCLFWPTTTTADGGKIGCRPNYGQVALSNHPAIVGPVNRPPMEKSGRSWPTPTALETQDQTTDWKKLAKLDKGGRILRRMASMTYGHPAQGSGSTDGSHRARLNPRWVETLMGLPIGWTMPSCMSPVTIAPMNSGSWGME